MANTKKTLTTEQKTEMSKTVKGLSTTSQKIRALNKAGFERADIARYLDKRYQHVRNVLTQPYKGGNE